MASPTHTVSVGKTQAVAGLLWLDTPGEDLGSVREQIRGAAIKFRSKYGVILDTSSRAQVGFLPEHATSADRRRPSAAAWLALTLTEPTVYIEELRDGRYWVVRTEPGRVDPRTDKILDEDDANRLIDGVLENLGGDDGQQRVVVNGTRPHSGLLSRHANIESRTFHELVADVTAPKPAAVTQVVGLKPATIAVIVGVLILIAAAWAGYEAYTQFKANQEFERRRAALAAKEAEAARLANETELRMKVAVDKAAQADTATVAADDLVAACARSIDEIGRRVSGWRVANITCTGDAKPLRILVDAPRSSGEMIGTAATLMHDAREQGYTVLVTPQAGRAALDQDVNLTKREGLKRAQLPTYQDVIRGVYSRLQMGRAAVGTLTYQFTPPVVKPVTYLDPALEGSSDPSRFKPVPPERSYQIGKLTLRGTQRWTLEAISLDYPFLSVSKLQLNVGRDGSIQWTLEADYVSNG